MPLDDDGFPLSIERIINERAAYNSEDEEEQEQFGQPGERTGVSVPKGSKLKKSRVAAYEISV